MRISVKASLFAFILSTSFVQAEPAKAGTIAADYPLVAVGGAALTAYASRDLSALAGNKDFIVGLSDFSLAAILPPAVELNHVGSTTSVLILVPFTGGPMGPFASPALSHAYDHLNNVTQKIAHPWTMPLVASAGPVILYEIAGGQYKNFFGELMNRFGIKSGYVVLSTLDHIREKMAISELNMGLALSGSAVLLQLSNGQQSWFVYQAALYAAEGAGFSLTNAALEKIKDTHQDAKWTDQIQLATSLGITALAAMVPAQNPADPTLADRFKIGILLSTMLANVGLVFTQLPTEQALTLLIFPAMYALKRVSRF